MNSTIESLAPFFSLGILVLCLLLSLRFGYRFLKYGGYKNAIFGGKIEKTYGEVSAIKKNRISRFIKVHKVLNSGKTEIGLEITCKRISGTQMEHFVISNEETVKLINHLEQAVNENYS